MTLYGKNSSGVWTEVDRPYANYNGVWKPVRQVWVKNGGTWHQVFQWDTTPPPPPELSITANSAEQWMVLGVRVPGATADTAAVRVLASTTGYPTNFLDKGYISTADSNYSWEPWSDYYYHGFKISGNGSVSTSTKYHADTSTFVYKQYPLNPTSKTQFTKGQRVYFSAWTFDDNGNVSDVTHVSFAIPKTATDTATVKSVTFTPQHFGTWTDAATDTWQQGDGIVDTNPRQIAVWDYADIITSIIANKPSTEIRSAYVKVVRQNDSGEAQANVSIFRHGLTDSGSSIPSVTESVFLGTIGKGATKWFPIPSSYYDNLKNGTIKGLGLNNKRPDRAAALSDDKLTVTGYNAETQTQTSGELRITWAEGVPS